jgi:hypothetical protein
VSPGPGWRALTPRPLGGGRGGVGRGGPRTPCYSGPQEGGGGVGEAEEGRWKTSAHHESWLGTEGAGWELKKIRAC